MLHLGNRGMAGDEVATRAALYALSEHSASVARNRPGMTVTICVYADAGDVTRVMRELKMAELLDGFRPTARMVVEPWLIEAALARRGDRQLSVAEQEIVVAATRRPGKVRWPNWWSVYGF
jgi:hypothetical protein